MTVFSAYSHLTQFARADPPVLAVILGSGLNRVAGRLRCSATAAFDEIPGMIGLSVDGHSGRITLGNWVDRRVLVFDGRLHYYECHSWDDVTFPVRLAFNLGVPAILFTNASGGIHDSLTPGSLMAIQAHIEWNRPYAWRSPGPGRVAGQSSSPYSPALLRTLHCAAETTRLALHHGTYAGVTGPCYETPAEIRALKSCGADAVGMSTTREVEAARSLGMACAGVSCVTNRAAGLTSAPIAHDEVLMAAAGTSDRLADLIQEFVRLL
jgi:purine-nucleoside phosphorylase